MARKNEKPRDLPGYEPVKGYPDPSVPRPKTLSVTHYAHRMGPVCGRKPTPTDAASYDNDNPTCPECAGWLAAARENTARLMRRPPQG